MVRLLVEVGGGGAIAYINMVKTASIINKSVAWAANLGKLAVTA